MVNTKISRLFPRWHGGELQSHHDIGPSGRTPRLALVADPQSGELNGMFVLSRLAAFLHGVEAGKRPGLQLRERLVIISTLGPFAVLHPSGVGSRQGVVDTAVDQPRWEGAAVDAVMDITQTAYYRVDIHPLSLEIEELPQISLYAPSEDERASACLFGLPAVIERPVEDDRATELVRAWRTHGGESFAIHAGQAGSLQTTHCEALFRGLVAFLDRTGIVSGLRLAPEEDDLRYFDRSQICVVPAEQAGIFSSRLEVGCWVRAGEELGRIYDGFTGGVQTRVIAPVGGLLASVRRQPMVRPGDLTARILMAGAARQRHPVRWLEKRHGRQTGQR